MLLKALKRALILKKVHAVIKFKQKRWLEVYISSNTYFRTIAQNDFDKNTNKLLCNSLHVKSIQSESNERDLCIITNEKKMRNIHTSLMHFKK